MNKFYDYTEVQKMIIWCWDFDRTITVRHTCSGEISQWERADLFTQDELDNLPNNIKNPKWLAEFFRKCHDAGDKIFIVTRNPNKAHVETYLNILLGGEAQRKEIINDIHCRLMEIRDKPGKNGHIEEVFIKNNLPWPPANPSSIVLVDDERNNCFFAEKMGLKIVNVDAANSYQEELNEIFENRANIENIDLALTRDNNASASNLVVMEQMTKSDFDNFVLKIEDITNLSSAKKYLDENLFKHDIEYSQKQKNITIVTEVFDALLEKLSNSFSVKADEVMDQISDFFDYINEPSRKAKLNFHKNKKFDTVFFKENTTSWSNMVRNFRETSLKKLFELQTTLSEHDRAEFLNRYRNKALFSEHRSNSIFTKLYNTDAVKAIDNAIAKYEKSSSKKARPNKSQ